MNEWTECTVPTVLAQHNYRQAYTRTVGFQTWVLVQKDIKTWHLYGNVPPQSTLYYWEEFIDTNLTVIQTYANNLVNSYGVAMFKGGSNGK